MNSRELVASLENELERVEKALHAARKALAEENSPFKTGDIISKSSGFMKGTFKVLEIVPGFMDDPAVRAVYWRNGKPGKSIRTIDWLSEYHKVKA